MDPVIKNFRNVYVPEGPAARLIWVEDNPPTCTMTYSEIYPGRTSAHHSHTWEHEIFIIKGSGTLICDGVEHAIRAGDAIYIPPGTDHNTLNNGGQGAPIGAFYIKYLLHKLKIKAAFIAVFFCL